MRPCIVSLETLAFIHCNPINLSLFWILFDLGSASFRCVPSLLPPFLGSLELCLRHAAAPAATAVVPLILHCTALHLRYEYKLAVLTFLLSLSRFCWRKRDLNHLSASPPYFLFFSCTSSFGCTLNRSVLQMLLAALADDSRQKYMSIYEL